MLHCYLGGTRTGLDGTTISPDLALIDVFAHNADAALDWAESIGVEWGETTSTILGAMWPRSHGLTNGNIIPILEKAARDAGVEIMLNTRGKEITMNVSVGEKVIYSKYAGTEVKLDGEEYIIVRQSDILAIVE